MFCKINRLAGRIAIAMGLVLVSTTTLAANESDYPKNPVRLVVATAAGGGGDMVARLFANKLSEELKQTVVVENRPGASGVIAATSVLRGAHDGYTLLLAITTYAQLPAIQENIPFDAKSDFIPISLIARSRNVLLVNRETKVKSVPELVSAISEKSAGFNYGSWGNGSTAHFMGELFNIKSKVHATHVPYKGSGPMMSDLLGGVISFAFSDIGAAQAHFDSDRVQPLAVTGGSRVDKLPNVPTMGELGYEGFDFGGWFGVLAPRGTPAEVVDTLQRASEAAGKDPAVQQKLTELSLDPVGSTGEEFATFLRKDMDTWSTIAKAAGIKTE